jgi:sulfide:quinone oxidoreductase
MADDDRTGDKPRVVIAGAGFAGVEAALALRDITEGRAAVEICDPRRAFVFQPFEVGEPYGLVKALRYDSKRLVELCGAAYREDGVVSVDAERRVAMTHSGERLDFDHMIVATGVGKFPGVRGATTFWGTTSDGKVAEIVAKLRAGALRHLVFTMPGNLSWALPLYELALLATTERGRAGEGSTQITVVTPEGAPLEVFGHRASTQMSELLSERGVDVMTRTRPIEFADDGLHIDPGGRIDADAVISLPHLKGREVEGLPHDADGFVEVDEHGLVVGGEGVYAAGDVTSFPIKQGGIAAQQADVVAEKIAGAAAAGGKPRPFNPVLRGILWTGREARYLYHRTTGRGEEESGFGERPGGPLHSGKVTARYLTPFFETLPADVEESSAGGKLDPSG